MVITHPLPPYLHNTQPMEPEDLPLQVALLTMEVGELRERMVQLSHHLEILSTLLKPDDFAEL